MTKKMAALLAGVVVVVAWAFQRNAEDRFRFLRVGFSTDSMPTPTHALEEVALMAAEESGEYE
jgi:hypothetical protein